MQKLGVTVRIVFSPLCTHTSESRHSSLYKCTLRSSPDKRNTVSHLPSARILWQGTTIGKAKTHTPNEIGDSLRVCELERDEFQVQWLPILCTEQQYSSTTVSTSGGWGQRRRDRDRDWDRWVVDAPAIFSHWKDAFGSQWIPYKFRNISLGSESL